MTATFRQPAHDAARAPWAALEDDRRLVLTLDAGGTNFVYSAVRGAREVEPPLALPAPTGEVTACLAAVIDGFRRVLERVGEPPAAISFGFPGPADYPAGIVGNTHNLPAFEGGVPLGPVLEDRFGVPVFVSNDGGLFTLGEAIAGFLPWVNGLLEQAGSPRRYRNLFGATLGTGFGGGLVLDNRLYTGDSGAAGEVWALRHKLQPGHCAEDGVSIRAVRSEYARLTGIDPDQGPEPRAIFEVTERKQAGDARAAREAFRRLGEVAGDTLASVVTLLDCLVVIGGGLSGAAGLFLPALVAEMNSRFLCAGRLVPRTGLVTYDLEDAEQRARFVGDDARMLQVPGTMRSVRYRDAKPVGVGLSRLGASRAAAVGAYAVALRGLDESGR